MRDTDVLRQPLRTWTSAPQDRTVEVCSSMRLGTSKAGTDETACSTEVEACFFYNLKESKVRKTFRNGQPTFRL